MQHHTPSSTKCLNPNLIFYAYFVNLNIYTLASLQDLIGVAICDEEFKAWNSLQHNVLHIYAEILKLNNRLVLSCKKFIILIIIYYFIV